MIINGEMGGGQKKYFKHLSKRFDFKKKTQYVIIGAAGLRVEIRIQNFPNNEAGIRTVTRSPVERPDIEPR
jgi:hypothetical protein